MTRGVSSGSRLSPDESTVRPLSPRSIVLFEDDPAQVQVMRHLLRRLTPRSRVQSFTDGAFGLRELMDQADASTRSSAPPSLILLDLAMPGLDGFEVLRELKAHEQLALVPVIIISSSANPRDIRRAYAEGANAYLTKVIDFEEYRRKFEVLVDFWLTAAELFHARPH